MVEPGIEPGTSWLVVRSCDYQATGMVCLYRIWGSKRCSNKAVTEMQCVGAYSASSDSTAVGVLRTRGVITRAVCL